MQTYEKHLEVYNFRINNEIYHFSFVKGSIYNISCMFTFAKGYLSTYEDNSQVEFILDCSTELQHKKKLISFLMQVADDIEYSEFYSKLLMLIQEIKRI